jgi:hypothetical protein
MEATGHLPGEHQLLAMFIDGLPTNAVSFVTLYDNVLNSLNDNVELPNLQHLFNHTIRIDYELDYSIRTPVLHLQTFQIPYPPLLIRPQL